MSTEEILCSTQQVIAGLEALRGENHSLLESLQGALESRVESSSGSVEQEKSGIVQQSLERIELGLSEAQVPKFKGPGGHVQVNAQPQHHQECKQDRR